MRDEDVVILKPPKLNSRGEKRKLKRLADRLLPAHFAALARALGAAHGRCGCREAMNALLHVPDPVLQRVIALVHQQRLGAFRVTGRSEAEPRQYCFSLRVLMPDVEDDVMALADEHQVWKDLKLVDSLTTLATPEEKIMAIRVALKQAQPGEPYSASHVVHTPRPRIAKRYIEHLRACGWKKEASSKLNHMNDATRARIAMMCYQRQRVGNLSGTEYNMSARVLWPSLPVEVIRAMDARGLSADLELGDTLVGSSLPDAFAAIEARVAGLRLLNRKSVSQPMLAAAANSASELTSAAPKKPGEPGYLEALCGTDPEGVQIQKFISELRLALESPVPYSTMDDGSKYQRWARLGFFLSQVADNQRWFQTVRKYTQDNFVNHKDLTPDIHRDTVAVSAMSPTYQENL